MVGDGAAVGIGHALIISRMRAPWALGGETGEVETDEELETGYGAATPAGDNLCNDYAQGLAEAFMALAEARGERVERRADAALTDGGSPSLFGNVAVVRRPVPTASGRRWPARCTPSTRGREGGPFIVFSAWPTPDLSASASVSSATRR